MRQLLFCLVWVCVASTTEAEPRYKVSYGELSQLAARTPDAVLAYGEDPLQRIFTWQASGETKASVVFIHGGCWLNAYNIDHSRGFLTDLAARGYTVYGVEYRRTGDEGGGWPGTFTDVREALQMLEKRLNDSHPVYVLGHSAGGHLALLAAPALAFADKIIGLAAITDIAEYAKGDNSCQAATPAFMQRPREQAPEAWHNANPRSYTMPASVLLMQGGADAIVPARQSVWRGVAQQLIEGSGHFDWLHPKSAAFAALLSVLNQSHKETHDSHESQ
ncbi:alpha/beta hydrolase [Alteromonas halophila]|uniref:alpha/beta hydrolase n=1 Tax=Alteromonas halophila TaxID=516698 RepID=UPI001672BB3C|nr:alpha/beta hydrolase [Alteromonas halophila]